MSQFQKYTSFLFGFAAIDEECSQDLYSGFFIIVERAAIELSS
jgi:hypothetical protein